LAGALCGGIETGGTWTVCALGRGPDELVAVEEFATEGPPETIERIIAFFSTAGRPVPAAIGIGAFGPLDLPAGSVATGTPKAGWAGASFAPVVRERLGVPVAFDTDVNAAAFGEHVWGAGGGAGSLAYLTVGTGIGVGLLHEGRPWHGLIHPEAGHLWVPRAGGDSFAGCCPVHGDCWEGLASGRALAERWECEPAELPAEHPAWELEAEYLALGVLAIVSVASPERLVAGGGVLERAGLLGRVGERVRELNAGYLDHPLLGERIDEYLVAPALGDRAGVLGAIALAQRLLRR
jgi:fructokinase